MVATKQIASPDAAADGGLPPRDVQLALYRTMCLIRRFEGAAYELALTREVRGTHPYIGQEAVAAGVCAPLRRDDYITSTHRGHGHCIAKGADVRRMMAELMGRSDGYCRGKGGSMHIADFSVGMLGANGIVGGSTGIATGAALASQLAGWDRVAVCFFGDGALNQGLLYEAGNMASLWKLPVVYICENNQYAMSTAVHTASAGPDLARRLEGFGIPGENVDGMDVLAVYAAARRAVDRARAGGGPTLLVCHTYRFLGHSAGDPLNYRTQDEVEQWRARDPIPRLRADLLAAGHLTPAAADAIDREIDRLVEDAVAFGRASPVPDPATAFEDVYA